MKVFGRAIIAVIAALVIITLAALGFVEDLCVDNCTIPLALFLSITILMSAAIIIMLVLLSKQFSTQLSSVMRILIGGFSLILASQMMMFVVNVVGVSQHKLANTLMIERGAVSISLILILIGFYKMNLIISKVRR